MFYSVSVLDNFVRKKMQYYLIGLGIYPNTTGYYSIIECVSAAVEKDSLAGKINSIYAEVAFRINKSVTAIERGIRFGVNKSISDNRMSEINNYFGYQVYSVNYPLRNGEFIGLFAKKVLDDYQKEVDCGVLSGNSENNLCVI